MQERKEGHVRTNEHRPKLFRNIAQPLKGPMKPVEELMLLLFGTLALLKSKQEPCQQGFEAHSFTSSSHLAPSHPSLHTQLNVFGPTLMSTVESRQRASCIHGELAHSSMSVQKAGDAFTTEKPSIHVHKSMSTEAAVVVFMCCGHA